MPSPGYFQRAYPCPGYCAKGVQTLQKSRARVRNPDVVKNFQTFRHGEYPGYTSREWFWGIPYRNTTCLFTYIFLIQFLFLPNERSFSSTPRLSGVRPCSSSCAKTYLVRTNSVLMIVVLVAMGGFQLNDFYADAHSTTLKVIPKLLLGIAQWKMIEFALTHY